MICQLCKEGNETPRNRIVCPLSEYLLDIEAKRNEQNFYNTGFYDGKPPPRTLGE